MSSIIYSPHVDYSVASSHCPILDNSILRTQNMSFRANKVSAAIVSPPKRTNSFSVRNNKGGDIFDALAKLC